MTSCIKPFNDLADFYCAKWISFQTNSMLDELVDQGLRQFPISFPSGTNAKIYLFVLVNKDVLLEDTFELCFEGENSVDRRERCRNAFEEKKITWKCDVDDLKIYIGSEVCLVMQGIAYTPNFLNETWHVPVVDSRRELIGWKPHRGSTNVFWRGNLKDASKVQEAITERLSGYGIPLCRIPSIHEIYNVDS